MVPHLIDEVEAAWKQQDQTPIPLIVKDSGGDDLFIDVRALAQFDDGVLIITVIHPQTPDGAISADCLLWCPKMMLKGQVGWQRLVQNPKFAKLRWIIHSSPERGNQSNDSQGRCSGFIYHKTSPHSL